jgi:GT2 family glycosyltransferase
VSAPVPSVPRVTAVVVTWNRRDLLEEALGALARQTHLPAEVVVVDNASTDGTSELLEASYPHVDLVRLTSNVGGAGGFAAGIEQALTHEPDLVWLLDDDTIPYPTAAEMLVRSWGTYPGVVSAGSTSPKRPALLASRVIWTDGRDHPMNTPRRKPGANVEEARAAEAVDAVPIRSASFVSIMCDADVVRERGLPVADYFLWNDDFEYSTRLLRGNVGLYCPRSVVEHRTKVFGSTDADPGERFFYEVRNKLWMFTRSRSLTPVEKLLYGGSTLRRWARTFAGSEDRSTLGRALGRGAVAALRGSPRSNAEVLESAGWGAGTPLRSGQPFSLLMSCYAGDDPGFLRDAFVSTVQHQARRPAEVVLVQDGPVPADLEKVIAELVADSPVPVQHLVMDENVGLGPALDRGLDACTHEVVARMDADDLSLPERFERQVPVVEAGADIVGSGLLEFDRSPDEVVGRRTPPTDPYEIRRVIRFRDPFNHPTVVYRKSAVQAAGGYTDMALMEDYLLFTRMVEAGARPANLAEPLVLYRVGAGAYARRGGTRLLRSELALQRRFRDLGLTSRAEYARNVAVRGGYRLVPEGIRRTAYRALIANRRGR